MQQFTTHVSDLTKQFGDGGTQLTLVFILTFTVKSDRVRKNEVCECTQRYIDPTGKVWWRDT